MQITRKITIKQKMTVFMGISFLFLVSCHELIAKDNEPEGYAPNRSLEHVRDIENKKRGYDVQVEGVSVFDY